MSINFKLLLQTPPCWARPTHEYYDTVLATVVRMVRNLPGRRFPGWSTAEDRAAVAEKLIPVLRSHPKFRSCYRAEMTELDRRDRCLLLERRQITPGMAARQDGCHLLISRTQDVFAMVNEEEHLCVHVSAPGSKLQQVLDTAASISRHLENNLCFARTAKDGYLTSLPQESGDGLQLFAVMHLPMLYLSGSIEKVGNALEQMHMSISPFAGDEDDCGNLFVISTQPIPANATEAVAEHFQSICKAVVEKEQLIGDLEFEREDGPDPVDMVYRSFGLLSYACTLDYREMLSALSLVRLGMRHYLLIASIRGERHFALPKEFLHLYELGPEYLRRTNRKIKTVRQAHTLRGDKVREALKLLSPVLPL